MSAIKKEIENAVGLNVQLKSSKGVINGTPTAILLALQEEIKHAKTCLRPNCNRAYTYCYKLDGA